jgi:DNA repair protein RadA/Sms
MAKAKVEYVCSQCGHVVPKWMGRCAQCGAWNTFEEHAVMPKTSEKSARTGRERGTYHQPKHLSEISSKQEYRIHTHNAELDRVLGGGIVRGGVALLGGDPGIGKSTLLLQMTENVASQHYKILYISGEESEQQIKMRAERMQIYSESALFLSEINMTFIRQTILAEKPNLVIIDSIQTMYNPEITSAPGSVTQIRENANALIQIAKKDNISMFLVGHVTKEGNLAGPRVLEHMVDTVLYFEGEKYHAYRMLRAVKNRFGSTNELGIFEMTDQGLLPVQNPSGTMLISRPQNTCGSVVVPIVEGTRPLLVELQGLVSPSDYANPRRMATGFDYNRMILLIAIVEKRVGINMKQMDAYINIVGGIRIDEPAADLAVCCALYSSFCDFEIPRDMLIFGEVGLTGEVRNIQDAEKRVLEGKKLGFKQCILPKSNENIIKQSGKEMTFFPVDNIAQAFHILKGKH